MATNAVIPSNPTPGGHAFKAFSITPSDSTELANATTSLWIGVTGTLKVLFNGDTVAVTLTAVPVGLLPISVKQVFATGTTCTGIFGLI